MRKHVKYVGYWGDEAQYLRLKRILDAYPDISYALRSGDVTDDALRIIEDARLFGVDDLDEIRRMTFENFYYPIYDESVATLLIIAGVSLVCMKNFAQYKRLREEAGEVARI